MKNFYKAKLSPGRKSWCVLLTHPLLPDANGKPRRVRYGLGTPIKEEAENIVTDINKILGNEDLWKPAAREYASKTLGLHSTALECFYDGIQAKLIETWASRDALMPLPTVEEGFTTVLITGPTGAGKTTLNRQLLGTDPVEKFPSTSKNRTTIFDTELICSPGDFHVVVSFLPPERVRSFIEECVESSIMAATEGLGLATIARRFLVHSEQRFRLGYIVGPFSADEDNASDEDDDEDRDGSDEEALKISVCDQDASPAKVADWVNRCFALGEQIVADVAIELGESIQTLSGPNKDALLQLVIERLRDREEMQAIIDEVFAAIEERFQLVKEGQYDTDKSGWPVSWRFTAAASDRSLFLKQVSYFSSNHAPLFGKLLTPLVDGMRVRGPFKPSGWDQSDEIPKLALLDGVGLGHMRGTSGQVPISVTKRYDLAQVILLVDDATRPMLEAAQSLLRSATASGHERKLAVVFTHFDQMKSDNFITLNDKKDSVLAALEQGIQGVEEALETQSGAGRRLRQALAERVFFMGHIDALTEKDKRTRGELKKLLQMLGEASAPASTTDAVATYDLADLMVRVWPATAQFHKQWNSLLLSEHWTRIRALTRRFADQSDDHYDTLQPVSDLRGIFVEKLGLFVANPRMWSPSNVSPEVKDQVVSRVLREFSTRLESYVIRRLREDTLTSWSVAYSRRYSGSTRARAKDIRSINEEVAPVPDEASPDILAQLLDDLRLVFREAAEAAGATILRS